MNQSVYACKDKENEEHAEKKSPPFLGGTVIIIQLPSAAGEIPPLDEFREAIRSRNRRSRPEDPTQN